MLQRILSLGFASDLAAIVRAIAAVLTEDAHFVVIIDGIERAPHPDQLLAATGELCTALRRLPTGKLIISWNAEHCRAAQELGVSFPEPTALQTRSHEHLDGTLGDELEFEIPRLSDAEMVALYELHAKRPEGRAATSVQQLSKYAKGLFTNPLHLRCSHEAFAGERIPYLLSPRIICERLLFFSADDAVTRQRRQEFLLRLAGRMYREMSCEIPREILAKDPEFAGDFGHRDDQGSAYAWFLKRRILVNRRGLVSFAFPQLLGFLIAETVKPQLLEAGASAEQRLARLVQCANEGGAFFPVLFAIDILLEDELAGSSTGSLQEAVAAGVTGPLVQVIQRKLFDLAVQRSPLLLEGVLPTLQSCHSGRKLLLDLIARLDREQQMWPVVELAKALLTTAEEARDPGLQQVLTYTLGRTLRHARVSHQDALAYLERALSLRSANRVDLGSIYRQMAAIHAARSDADSALQCYRQAIEARQRAGPRRDQFAVLIEYGQELQRLGRLPEAHEQYQAALRLGQKLAQPELQVTALYRIGSVLDDQKQYRDAMLQFEACRQLGEEVRSWPTVVQALNRIGMIHKVHHELEKALAVFVQARGLAERFCDERTVQSVVANLGMIYKMKGDLEKARECYRAPRGGSH